MSYVLTNLLGRTAWPSTRPDDPELAVRMRGKITALWLDRFDTVKVAIELPGGSIRVYWIEQIEVMPPEVTT